MRFQAAGSRRDERALLAGFSRLPSVSPGAQWRGWGVEVEKTNRPPRPLALGEGPPGARRGSQPAAVRGWVVLPGAAAAGSRAAAGSPARHVAQDLRLDISCAPRTRC